MPDHPVDQLRTHPDNVRVHDEESVRVSLLANLQYKPIVVQRSTGYVLVGNGTLRVATKQLGWTTIDAFVLDVDDAAAKKIMLADNVLGEKGTYRLPELAELLGEYADGDADAFAGTGYDLADYETLLAELEDAAAAAALPAPRAAPEQRRFHDDDEDGDRDEDEPVDEPEPEAARVVLEFDEPDDAAEFRRLTSAAASVLRADGTAVPTPQLALRALRVLVSALDHRHEFGAVDMATLLRAADAS